MLKKTLFFLFASLLVLTLAACGSNSDDKESSNSKGSDSKEAEAETIEIKQELGNTEVPKNPKKVVVFDFGVLDSLDKLGIEVAGVAKGGVIPSYLEKYESDDYENVGSLKEPDFEKIAEIDPDVIFISGRQSAVYDQLAELAPTVFLGVDTANYMESFKANMNTLGEIFDKQSEIEEELAIIDSSIEELNKKSKKKDQKALITLANDDKISAYGSKSRFGIIHDVFGVPAVDENIEASTHGMNVSFEYVMEQNPDLLYVVDRSAAIGEEPAAKNIVENDLVKETNAFKNDNIAYLDPEYWYLSGGGLVSVQEMIKEIDATLK